MYDSFKFQVSRFKSEPGPMSQARDFSCDPEVKPNMIPAMRKRPACRAAGFGSAHWKDD